METPSLQPPIPPSPASSSPSFGQKKIVFLLPGVILLLLVGGFLLLGRKSRQKEGGGKIVLTWWGLWEPQEVVAGVIAAYQKNHPQVEIRYRKLAPSDYRARLTWAFREKSGAPDIFRFHATWLPMLIDDLAPVPERVVKKTQLESFYPVVKDTLYHQGQYWGIPLMVDTLALFYNQELLQLANINPPRTWWGLQQLAREKKVVVLDPGGRIKTALVALGTTNNVDHFSDIIGLMLFQNGANPASPNSELVADVLRFYTLFAQEYRVWSKDLPASTLAFASGKLAFYFAPSWRIFNLFEANPNLKFGVAPVPQLPAEETANPEEAEAGKTQLTNINWATFWVEGVWRESPKKEAAWEFLSWLASKEGLQLWYQAQSQIRLFGELPPRPDLAESIKSDPLLQPFVTQAQTAKTWYLCSFTWDEGINERMIKYWQDAINGFLTGKNQEEILATLEAGVKQVLASWQL